MFVVIFRHWGKYEWFWALRRPSNGKHSTSLLRAPSHGSTRCSTRMAGRRSILPPPFPVIWPLPKNLVQPSSHLPLLILPPYTRVSLPLCPSHSHDSGIRVAPTPSRPGIMLPCHYSVVPPAAALSGAAESAGPPLRTSAQPQMPLVGGVVPTVAPTPWKMMQRSGVRSSLRAAFSISRGGVCTTRQMGHAHESRASKQQPQQARPHTMFHASPVVL